MTDKISEWLSLYILLNPSNIHSFVLQFVDDLSSLLQLSVLVVKMFNFLLCFRVTSTFTFTYYIHLGRFLPLQHSYSYASVFCVSQSQSSVESQSPSPQKQTEIDIPCVWWYGICVVMLDSIFPLLRESFQTLSHIIVIIIMLWQWRYVCTRCCVIKKSWNTLFLLNMQDNIRS